VSGWNGPPGPNLRRTTDGPLTQELADEFTKGLTDDRDAFSDQFATGFFSAGDELRGTEEQRQAAISLCKQSRSTERPLSQ
jgi:hypothetical protein